MRTVYFNGAYYLPPDEIERAWKENRVGELNEPGENVNSDGTKEEDLKFAIFASGTIGYYVVDAFRITLDGRIYEGSLPVPVRLSDVTYADEEEFKECLEKIKALGL